MDGSGSAHTDRIIEQGCALVRAIEALDTIEPTGPIEQFLVWFLQSAYKHRLRAIVKTAPSWVTEEILRASERMGGDRAVSWISRN
jgi:hypothetical protein